MVPQRERATTSNADEGLSRVVRHPFVATLTLALAIALAASACVGEVPAVPTDDAQLVEGRAIYASNCVGCHGPSGAGGTGPKLTDGAVAAKYPDLADQLDIVANGRNQMPAFTGKLTDAEVEAVVRFTREGL